MPTSSASGPTFADNIVVAHQGQRREKLPENSIASLREAIRLGCAGTEFDVRLTADDSLLVVHDERHGGLEVARHTYDELTAIPLANGEKLPTLREYLVAGMKDNSGTRLVCELKPSEVVPSAMCAPPLWPWPWWPAQRSPGLSTLRQFSATPLCSGSGVRPRRRYAVPEWAENARWFKEGSHQRPGL